MALGDANGASRTKENARKRYANRPDQQGHETGIMVLDGKPDVSQDTDGRDREGIRPETAPGEESAPCMLGIGGDISAQVAVDHGVVARAECYSNCVRC